MRPLSSALSRLAVGLRRLEARAEALERRGGVAVGSRHWSGVLFVRVMGPNGVLAAAALSMI